MTEAQIIAVLVELANEVITEADNEGYMPESVKALQTFLESDWSKQR